MKQAPNLTHEQIVSYNRQADRVQGAVREKIDFLRARTLELNGLAADSNHFRVQDGEPMTNLFGAVLSNPRLEKDATKRTALEKLRAERMHEFCDLVSKMRAGDREALLELDALWKEQIDLYIRAKSNFLMFFRTVNLQPNEQVMYQHTYRNEVNVKYIGEDGGPRTRKAVAAQKQTFFDMKELHSEEVGYQIRDINQGPDIAQMAQKTVDIAWDMEAKLNDLAKTLFMTLFGAFTTTGNKLNRTYVPNQYINTANLPTTNALQVPGITAASQFIPAIREIMKYSSQWGDVWGEPITPTGIILIPSLHATDLSLEVLPTGEHGTIVTEKIVAGNYLRFEWFDRVWTLVPDVTLSPTDGYAYAVMNQTVGDYFTKPSMDETFVEVFRKKNWETRSAMKVIQMCSPQPRAVNAIRIKYRT